SQVESLACAPDGKPQPGPDPRQSAAAVSDSVGASLPGSDTLLRTLTSQPAELPGDDLGLHPWLQQRRLQARIWRADPGSPAHPPRSWLAGILPRLAAAR